LVPVCRPVKLQKGSSQNERFYNSIEDEARSSLLDDSSNWSGACRLASVMKQRLTVDLVAHSLRVELQTVMVVQPANKNTYLLNTALRGGWRALDCRADCRSRAGHERASEGRRGQRNQHCPNHQTNMSYKGHLAEGPVTATVK
jgi:hypothetical protein